MFMSAYEMLYTMSVLFVVILPASFVLAGYAYDQHKQRGGKAVGEVIAVVHSALQIYMRALNNGKVCKIFYKTMRDYLWLGKYKKTKPTSWSLTLR